MAIRAKDIGLGVALTGALACVVAGERFGAALATRAAVELTAVPPAAGEPPVDDLEWLWTLTTVVGVVLGAISARTLVGMAEIATRSRLRDEPGSAPGDRTIAGLRRFAYAAVAVWALWQIAALGLPSDKGQSLITGLHLVAIILGVCALACAGGALGDPLRGWRQASVIRVQLVVLLALFAVVFLVPITAGQVTDVLRAWGDGPFSRAAAGLAAALLLGAVVRASATRILTPSAESSFWRDRPKVGRDAAELAVFGTLLVGAAAALWLQLWLGGGALALFAAIAAATRWSTAAGAGRVAEQPRLRRLPESLAAVPLAVVFAGLVSATTDSILLPAPATDTDLNLIAITVAAGLVLAVLAGLSRPGEDGADAPESAQRAADDARNATGRWKHAWSAVSMSIGLAGFAAALAVGVVRALDASSDVVAVVDAVVCAALLGGSLVIALPRIDSLIAGAPQFWAATGVVLGMVGAVYLEPVAAPRAFGAIAVVFAGATAVLLVLHLAGTIGDRRELRSATWMPGPLRGAAGWLPDRVPVLTIVVIWVFAGALLAHGTVHQARTIASQTVPGELEAELNDWLDAAWDSADRSGGDRVDLPMLLVAASGGGAKAAYWTDLVLDCIFGDGLPSGSAGGTPDDPAERECAPSGTDLELHRRLFLTSSVSGGSVGIQHFVRSGLSAMQHGETWVDAAAGPEVLSPIAAWGLFHDLPVSMLRGKTDPRECRSAVSCRWHADRALIQEAAVARFADGLVPPAGEGLLDRTPPAAARAGELRTPLMIFNGALDGAHGRVLMSRAQLAPPRLSDPGCRTPWTTEPAAGSIDGHDVINAQQRIGKRVTPDRTQPLRYKRVRPYKDVPLVTAALLSARFPFVAPAGRLGVGDTLDRCTLERGTLPAQWIRDGGYVENSGVLTIVELLPELRHIVREWRRDPDHRRARVQFVVVSIDDDAAVTGDDVVRLRHRNSPLGIGKQVGKSYVTRLARDRLESCQYRDVTYRRLSPNPHPGATAATGWEVSETVRTHDLGDALRSNKQKIDELRDILTGTASSRECPS